MPATLPPPAVAWNSWNLGSGSSGRRRPFVLAGRWLPALPSLALPRIPSIPGSLPSPPSSLYFLGGGLVRVEAWEGSGFVCGVGQGLWAPSFQMQEVCS